MTLCNTENVRGRPLLRSASTGCIRSTYQEYINGTAVSQFRTLQAHSMEIVFFVFLGHLLVQFCILPLCPVDTFGVLL